MDDAEAQGLQPPWPAAELFDKIATRVVSLAATKKNASRAAHPQTRPPYFDPAIAGPGGLVIIWEETAYVHQPNQGSSHLRSTEDALLMIQYRLITIV